MALTWFDKVRARGETPMGGCLYRSITEPKAWFATDGPEAIVGPCKCWTEAIKGIGYSPDDLAGTANLPAPIDE